MSLKDLSIAFIGAGHITEIIVSNLAKAENIISKQLIVSDPVNEKPGEAPGKIRSFNCERQPGSSLHSRFCVYQCLAEHCWGCGSRV